MECIYGKLPVMILISSVKGTWGRTADSVSLGRNSNYDPDRLLSIIIDNNDTTSSSRTIEDDSCKLGNGSLSHMFCCKSKRCQFQEKFFLKT